MDQEETKMPSMEDTQESDPKARKEAEKAARERARVEAEEAKQRARREAAEAKEQAKQEAQEAKERAKREAEEARERAKREAEEAKETAKQAREAGKRAKKEELSKGKVISADDKELLSGSTTLFINQGAHGSKINYLARSLSADKNIKVLSSGGASGKNSWISLSIQNSTPLFQDLYQIPVVQTVTRKNNIILLTLTEGELTREKSDNER